MSNSELSSGVADYETSSRLQRACDVQAVLLAMVGRDLRQSSQVIRGTHELLRTRARDESEQAWLDLGERAIARLTEQLDRLLSALRLYQYTKTIEVSSVALAPLFWQLRNENEVAALRRGIDLQVCATRAHVVSNPVLLACILRNLVTKAVKHTEPGGRILIGCRRSGSEVRIEVCDTGVSIASDQFPRTFDAFERLDSERCDGLGIGLFVVRHALELLGHRIEIRSAVSQGSRFSLIAPRA